MSKAPESVDRKFAELVERMKGLPGVTVGLSKKKGFGASALCIHERIFAMVSSKGQFVVKLPKEQVAALSQAGLGESFAPSPGRQMKEWLALKPGAQADWSALAREAMGFVAKQK